MRRYDVAVIGAGPAGIMAAITASQTGSKVALIEKNPQIGRKLLATGNGRCNLTNKFVTVERYHGANPNFIQTVLRRLDQYATMEFFENLGLVLKEEDNGRMFPRTNQASSVVEVLKHSLSEHNVDILLDAQVKSIDKPSAWKISLIDGRIIEAGKLVIATGGRASHYLGSTGDGLYWAQKMGHSITPIYQALVPIETVETWPQEVQGTKVEAKVWATSGNKTISEETGDLLFTRFGVSGLAVMAQARRIAPVLHTSQVLIHIDLFPEMTDEHLHKTVSRVLAISGRLSVEDSLIGLLPNSLIPVILRFAKTDGRKLAAKVSKIEQLDIVKTLKDLTLTVSKLRPLKEAYVTAGGLVIEEINPESLESKLIQGLYFAGEIIDVDGDSGGFNLQWAWSSGYVAGMSAQCDLCDQSRSSDNL